MNESGKKETPEKNSFYPSDEMLRLSIGIMAVALPLLLVIGAYIFDGHFVGGSISAYYYSSMRFVFVIIMFITAAFFLTYKPDYIDGCLR